MSLLSLKPGPPPAPTRHRPFLRGPVRLPRRTPPPRAHPGLCPPPCAVPHVRHPQCRLPVPHSEHGPRSSSLAAPQGASLNTPRARGVTATRALEGKLPHAGSPPWARPRACLASEDELAQGGNGSSPASASGPAPGPRCAQWCLGWGRASRVLPGEALLWALSSGDEVSGLGPGGEGSDEGAGPPAGRPSEGKPTPMGAGRARMDLTSREAPDAVLSLP